METEFVIYKSLT